MSFTEIILKTPTVCLLFYLVARFFSKVMTVWYNTGDKWYCFQLLIRIFNSEYPKSFTVTENMPLRGEETHFIFKHFVIFNLTFFTPGCPSDPLFRKMTTCQVFTASTTSQPNTFHRSIHNP